MRKVVEAGGEVLGEPTEIPGIGQYVSFLDTEGNRCSMLSAFSSNVVIKWNEYENESNRLDC